MPKMPRMFVFMLIICAAAAGVPVGASGQTAESQPPAPAEAPVAQQPVPVQPQTALALGVEQYKQGNYEEAFDALTRAREQDPNSSVVAYYLGATLKKMQLYDKAIPHLLASVSLQPPATQGFLELADAYYAVGKLDEALQALKVAEQERLDPGQVEFLRAQVLSKKGKYAEATASFEKAKAADQKLAGAAEFQIAMIRLRLGKRNEAYDQFKSIADRDPESDSGIMAKQQADTLAKQLGTMRQFTATANAQYQFDSNVILKPDVASATTTSISGEKDTAAVLSLHAGYTAKFEQPYGLKFLYNGYLSSYQKLKAYDVQSHTLGAEPSYQLGENLASLPITFTYTLVDNKKYLQSLSLTPTYLFVTGREHYALATIKYQNKDYLTSPFFPEENRDATNIGAGISWFRLIGGQKGFASLKYELDKESASGSNWSYLGNKAGAGLLYPLADAVKLALGIEVYRQSFDNVNTFTGVTRTDTSYMGSVLCLYALTQTIDAQAQYVAMKTNSTMDVYGYSKNIFSIGLSARF